MQNNGLKRNTIDKFYTSYKVVNKCIELIKSKIDIKDNDLCIEPSAGNGSFINAIKSLFNHYKFYDIEPDNLEIIKLDYLKFNYIPNKKYNKIHIIGNPPFGRQSSLAIKFIKKSINFCDSISFILPKSFKKESLKKKINLYFHLESEFDLPYNSFFVNDIPYNVPCVFQIWIKKKKKRKIPKILIENGFKFVKKNESPDISFRRIGAYAGKIDKICENKSIQSHYFIKFNNDLTDDLFNKLSNINFETKYFTCGPPSISKQEIIKKYNSI